MKAVVLISGGLDSALAVRLMVDQGVDVIGVHFVLPVASNDPAENDSLRCALNQCERLGIHCEVVTLGREFIKILLRPKHGYGKGMNPCMDCHILMLKMARKIMERERASFVVTGEVVGQRPKSQMKKDLGTVERESGLEGLLLRPLSAKHLPLTVPEQEGCIEREKLLAIEGRRRREQLDMAEAMGLEEYQSPAGGCLFTDKSFAAKVREHIDHDELTTDDIVLLKTGRHFRLPDGSKLVLGRNEVENNQLESMNRPGDRMLHPLNVMGPVGLMRGGSGSEDVLGLAGEIIASYCDGDQDVNVSVRYDGKETQMNCVRRRREDFDERGI